MSSYEIRAGDGIKVGDLVNDDCIEITVATVDTWGDTVLIEDTDGDRHSFDRDTVVTIERGESDAEV